MIEPRSAVAISSATLLISLPALLLWFWPEGAIDDFPILPNIIQLACDVIPSIEKISSASEYPEASKVGMSAAWLLMPIVILHIINTDTIFGFAWHHEKASAVLGRMSFARIATALLFLIAIVFSIYRFEPSMASSTRIGRFLSHAFSENQIISGLIASAYIFAVPLFSLAIGMYLKALIKKSSMKKGV